MELISTQRMSYESWLHTWNLEDDDDFSSGDDDDGESRDTNTKERSATLKDLRTVQRRECSHEEEINGQCCAICLSRFTKKREEKSDDDGNKQRAGVQRCFRLAELPCKHVYHEECIESWLARSRRCPTCRKSLREKKKKTGTQARNGSEERLISRPNDDEEEEEDDDDDDARAHQSRRELERESVRRLREMETRARERRAREVEEERRARRRNRMETVLEHEGMNEEIFERVMEHAIGLLEEATIGREEEEDVEDAEEDAEEKEKERTQRMRVANRSGTGSLLVGTRGCNYGSNTL